jgi:hypothetical protein
LFQRLGKVDEGRFWRRGPRGYLLELADRNLQIVSACLGDWERGCDAFVLAGRGTRLLDLLIDLLA